PRDGDLARLDGAGCWVAGRRRSRLGTLAGTRAPVRGAEGQGTRDGPDVAQPGLAGALLDALRLACEPVEPGDVGRLRVPGTLARGPGRGLALDQEVGVHV